MFKLTLKINGQVVDPRTIADPKQAIVIRHMEDHLKQQLRSVLCPEHRKTPEVTVLFEGGKQHVHVQGCCDRLVEMTMQALLHP